MHFQKFDGWKNKLKIVSAQYKTLNFGLYKGKSALFRSRLEAGNAVSGLSCKQ